MMTIKEKLAVKIEQLCGDGYSCNPNDLHSNRGCLYKSDIATWYGYVRTKDTGQVIYSICSYSSMTELVKKKTPLSWVGRDYFEIT